jgi:RNA polymerase sigma-70 factor, ECF subfamily
MAPDPDIELMSAAALNPCAHCRIPMAMLTATVTDCLPEFPRVVPAVDSDHALARSAARGEVTAFETLYRRHVGRVHGVIARLVGHQGARAEDLTQETFVRAWQALPGYRFESAFGTWLHRLAANTALMELRSRRSRPQSGGDEDLDDFGTPDSAGHVTALSLDLERAVATLPPRARAVLVLFDVEGWKHEEIAEALGMAVGSSKAQLHRARSLLRTRLGENT